jgi:hypothetical protein
MNVVTRSQADPRARFPTRHNSCRTGPERLASRRWRLETILAKIDLTSVERGSTKDKFRG